MPITSYDCSEMRADDIRAKIRSTHAPALLKFSSEGCPPCRALKTDLDGYRTDLAINIFELKRTQNSDLGALMEKYEITSFPTLVVVDENLTEVDKVIGYSGASGLHRFIEKHRGCFGASRSRL